MNTHDELFLWHALHRLEATYWYDVDFNEGRTAHEFFTPDGVKTVGRNRFEGVKRFGNFMSGVLVKVALKQCVT